jgi:hypothetical protein
MRHSAMSAVPTDHGYLIFIELGAVVIGLAVLARLARVRLVSFAHAGSEKKEPRRSKPNR